MCTSPSAPLGRATYRPQPVTEDTTAGALIEQSGLKGFSVGGAAVSEKHAGFVINKGNATAADIVALSTAVCEKIKAETGVTMEPEVRFVGEF